SRHRACARRGAARRRPAGGPGRRGDRSRRGNRKRDAGRVRFARWARARRVPPRQSPRADPGRTAVGALRRRCGAREDGGGAGRHGVDPRRTLRARVGRLRSASPPRQLGPRRAHPRVSVAPMTPVALVRLLQLASPTLPVGAYSYSQGLESAIDAGRVKDADSAERWIADVLALSIASLEGPVLLRLMGAWDKADLEEVRRWNDEFVASRETAELRAETLQMGFSLRSLV